MSDSVNVLKNVYCSMTRSLFDMVGVDMEAEPEAGHQFILIFSFGMLTAYGEKNGSNNEQIFELIFDMQKKVIREDDYGAKISIDCFFEEINDCNPVLGTYGMLFSEGGKSLQYWVDNDIRALSSSLNDALADAEFEVFGCRKISKGEDSGFNDLRIPTIEQLPPPDSGIQHYSIFSRRFNPVPYFKILWDADYGTKAADTWSLNVRCFKEKQPSGSSLEELLLCIEYGCSVGPYLGGEDSSKEFFRWVVSEIKLSLKDGFASANAPSA